MEIIEIEHGNSKQIYFPKKMLIKFMDKCIGCYRDEETLNEFETYLEKLRKGENKDRAYLGEKTIRVLQFNEDNLNQLEQALSHLNILGKIFNELGVKEETIVKGLFKTQRTLEDETTFPY